LTSQYLLSLLMFVVQHKDLFITSVESHNLETRQSNDLYITQANLSIYQKGAYYSVIKIFNKLPSNIKNVNGNIAKFKTTLKKMFIHEFILHIKRILWPIMIPVINKHIWMYILIFTCVYLQIYDIWFIVDLFCYACICYNDEF
jgi:hypothetical protein